MATLLIRYTLSIATAAAFLTGCGGYYGGSAPITVTGHGAAQTSRSFKIYVANIGNGTITTYQPNGTQTTPTIETGTSATDYLFGMAVGPDGKIYALNFHSLEGSNSSGALTTFLYGVAPTDPMTLAGAAALFLAVACVACLAPTLRATRVDPAEALRYE